MSGIVGIVNLDREEVDRDLLLRMTKYMAFRGPDAQECTTLGHVGLGHALLRTTDESEHEQQPFTLDGQVWIVADARIDAQSELKDKLSAGGEVVVPGITDVELLLRAYKVWGEGCVEYLLGDFCFAIWDAPRERLFCARDHLGVKPFFYAQIGEHLIFSNTLDCVRQHPLVSATLNDLAIADFLLFGRNQEPDTTSFAEIKRMPPAHCISWSHDRVKIWRYWRLPIEEPIYFKRDGDYIDQFNHLLRQAVGDRLRTNRVGVFMSGGLDSSALAATAKTLLSKRSDNSELHAFTYVFDGVIDHREGYYAQLVADKLDIPIHYRHLFDEMLSNTGKWEAVHNSEPYWNPMLLAGERRFHQSIAGTVRVMMYGEGPDSALLYEWKPYLRFLAKQRQLGRLSRDVFGHIIRHRRVPLLPTIPRMLRKWWSDPDWTPRYPTWLNKDFANRLDLPSRWRTGQQQKPSIHPVRPVSHYSFDGPLWEPLLQQLDAGQLKVPLEVRHPYVDLRLLSYMLRVPAIPWCRRKHLLRCALRGALPEPILRRSKRGLLSDPEWLAMQRNGPCTFSPSQMIRFYVDTNRVPEVVSADMIRFRTDFRVFGLNYWLQNVHEPN
jgi:asparagine synthase (glutamine-hydrolysing)